MPGLRRGPCSPWCAGPDIQALPAVVKAAGTQGNTWTPDQVGLICAEAATAASEVLYELSGRIYTGQCGPHTIRPVSRPTDADTRTWGAMLSPMGWFSSWGMASSYGAGSPGVRSHYYSSDPPTIRLPYPVTEILQVLIDGVIIPADEYELRNNVELVRIRPTASFTPTERWGWPTSQIMDLPDSQEGTFSVTFRFGIDPPAAGQLAAKKLGEMLALPQLGDTTAYPNRVTSIARQGVTMQVASVIDLLEKKSSGIYEVDLFLNAVNPDRLKRQATVWSPDVARPRRQANPSLPS